MVSIDCSLNAFKIPGFSNYSHHFGTFAAPDEPITSRDEAANMEFPFLYQRPFIIQEDSTTSVVEHDSRFIFIASGLTLTLAQASFELCLAVIRNVSTGPCSVAVSGQSTLLTIPAKSTAYLCYSGTTWIVYDETFQHSSRFEYIDSAFYPKAASVAAIPALLGYPVIDGYQTVESDYVLVKDQSNPADNGLYQVLNAGWSKVADIDVLAKLIPVSDGTINKQRVFSSTRPLGSPVITYLDTNASSYKVLASLVIRDSNGQVNDLLSIEQFEREKLEIIASAESSQYMIANTASSVNPRRMITIKAGTVFRVKVGDSIKSKIFSVDTDYDIEAIYDPSKSISPGLSSALFAYYDPVDDQVKVGASLIDSANGPNLSSYGDVSIKGIFHHFCADMGSQVSSQYSYWGYGSSRYSLLRNYKAGDILPFSCIDRTFAPYIRKDIDVAYASGGPCGNPSFNDIVKGYGWARPSVYIPPLGIWVNIYLQTAVNIAEARFGQPIIVSRQYVDFVSDQWAACQELLSDSEFEVAMLGSNEGTNIKGSSFPPSTGGHEDTKTPAQRLVSIWGVEDGCGVVYQWLRTTAGGGAVGAMSGLTAPSTYGWFSMTTSSYGPRGQAGRDGTSSSNGNFYGLASAMIAGGSWSDGASCGSRSRYAASARSYAYASCGARGRARPLGKSLPDID